LNKTLPFINLTFSYIREVLFSSLSQIIDMGKTIVVDPDPAAKIWIRIRIREKNGSGSASETNKKSESGSASG
jgi:hypothetical protein